MYSFLFELLHIFTYDLVLWVFSMVIHTYFRDIIARGEHYIPKSGPIIFVIAPHANQFVDPLVVMSKVKEHAERRIAFLIAAKSFKQRVVGSLAKLTDSIPVERAQDLLKRATGTIKVESFDDETIISGTGTKFLSECSPKGLIALPYGLGTAQILSIESDTRLTLRKPFSKTKKEAKLNELLQSGTEFKAAPHIDNDFVFRHVFKHLNKGKVLGIFPEGGSHDRPNLLPLKAGVAIMALGALSTSEDPNFQINVIPVGLNYFHPHKFRSRCVIEFGKPIIVDNLYWGLKYEKNSKTAINDLLDTITSGLSTVTVSCIDYDTLMVLQAARRLFTAVNRENIPISMVVEMNRRIIKGYEKYANDPELLVIKAEVANYNTKLKQLGLRDHQVEDLRSADKLKTFIIFVERLFKVVLFLGLLLPGVVLFSPVFIVGRKISRRKAREALAGSNVKIKANDVLATWKILVAMGLAPCLYIFYSVIGTILIQKLEMVKQYGVPLWAIFSCCYGWSVLTTYASLRIGEIGVDYYKSLKPLMYSVLSHEFVVHQIKQLKQQRKDLSQKVTDFCDSRGPNLFKDYKEFYNNYNNISDDYYNSDDEKLPISKTSTSSSVESGKNLHSSAYLGDVPIFSNIGDVEDEEDNEEAGKENGNVTEMEIKIPDSEPPTAVDEESEDTVVRKRK